MIVKKKDSTSYSDWAKKQGTSNVQKKNDVKDFASWKKETDAENARKAEEEARAQRHAELTSSIQNARASVRGSVEMGRINNLQTQIDALDRRPTERVRNPANANRHTPQVQGPVLPEMPEMPDYSLQTTQNASTRERIQAAKDALANIRANAAQRHAAQMPQMQTGNELLDKMAMEPMPDFSLQPNMATGGVAPQMQTGNELLDKMEREQMPDFSLKPNMATGGVAPEQPAQVQPRSMMELLAEQTITPEEIHVATPEEQKALREDMQNRLREEQLEAKRRYWDNLKNMGDFAEKSQIDPYDRTGNRPGMGAAPNNAYGNAMQNIDWGGLLSGDSLRSAASTAANAVGYQADADQQRIDMMTDEELATMTYLRNTMGEDAANEYFEDLSRQELNRRVFEQREQGAAEYGAEHPVLGTVQSVFTNLANETIAVPQSAANWIDGKEIDPYGVEFWAGSERNAMRAGARDTIVNSEAAKNLDGFFGAIGIPNMSDRLYNAITSNMDSMLNMMAGKTTGTGMLLMGSGAAGDTIREARLKGASNDQAMLLGFAAGIIEAATEKMGADRIMDMIANGNQGLLASWLRNMGSEFMEEGVGEILNSTADSLIMGDKSEWQKSVKSYMADGMSYDEAVKQTWIDKGNDVLNSAVQGALGGALMGGGVAITNATVGHMAERNAYKADEQARIDALREYGAQGMTLDEVKEQHPEALETMSDEEAQAQLDMGEQVSRTADEAETPKSRIAQLAQSAADKLLHRQTEQETQTAAQTQQETQNQQTQQQATQQTAQTTQESAQTQQDKQTQQAQKPVTQAQGTAQAQQTAQQTKRTLETDVQAVMEANYKGGDRAAYEAAFNRLYAAGEAAVPLQMVQKKAPDVIKAVDAATQQAIWQAGNNAAMTKVTPGVKKLYTSKISQEQRGQVRVLEELGKRYNTEFVVVDSLSGANGSYRNGQGRIVVALDAQEGAIVQAAAHELVHYAKDMSQDAYDFLKDNVLETLGKEGIFDLDEAISKRAERYKAQIEGMSEEEKREYLTEEIVAEAVPAIFTNEESVRTMVAKNRTLAEKLRDFFVNFAKSLREIAERYTDRTKHGELAVMMSQDAQTLSDIADMFSAALDVAAEENAQRQAAFDTAGGVVAENGTSAAIDPAEARLSLASLNESDYVRDSRRAAEALSEKMGVSIEEAQKYIDQMTTIAAMIQKDTDLYDYEAEREYSAMKPNSDYKWTIDFSTLCSKRLIYTGTFDVIQKELANTVLTEDDFIRLRQMLSKEKDIVPCAFCYVESRRKDAGKYINNFVEIYREAQAKGEKMGLGPKGTKRFRYFATEDGFTPTIADFNTTEGVTALIKNHHGVYDAYQHYVKSIGVSKPRLVENMTDYRGEILQKFSNARTVAGMNKRGGLRVQSFSDFQMLNLLDMMQVTTDMARVGLKSQAYTKVPAFARIFGNTGIKINLSLVAKGVDADGHLIFDDIEGMDHEEAFDIRSTYSRDVGTVLISKDDETTRAALADPRIDFVIPFHKSGWSQKNLDALGIGDFQDFTKSQNEKDKETGKGTKNFFPSDYWDYTKSGDENAQIYLQKCAESGKEPKFPQFMNEPGYWKLLIDFKMYDNNGVGQEQMPVHPDFNMDEARRYMEQYDGSDNHLPVDRKVASEFVEEYKAAHPGAHFSLSEDADISDISDGETVEIPGAQDIKLDSVAIQKMAEEALLKGDAMARVEGKRVAAQTLNEHVRSLVGNAAGRIVRELGSKYKRADLANRMAELVQEYSLNGASEETLRETTRLAKDVVEQATKQDNSLREKYADVRKKLHETGIQLTETQKQEAANQFGSYELFKRRMMGTVKLSRDGISLDALWSELSDAAPEIFAPDTNEAQMIDALQVFKEAMKPRTVSTLGMDADTAAADLGLRIQADVLAAIGARDAARQIYEARSKYQMSYKENVKQILAEQRKKDAQKYQELAQQLKQAKAQGDATGYSAGMARYRALVRDSGMREMIAQAMGNVNMQKELNGENRRAREAVTKKAYSLAQRLERPQKGKRVPTMLQGVVMDVLNALDINSEYSEMRGQQTKSAKDWKDRLNRLAEAYERIWNSQTAGQPADGMNGAIMALCERQVEALKDAVRNIVEGNEQIKIGMMDARSLRQLHDALNIVEHTIDSVGKIWSNSRYESVEDMAQASIEELDARDAQKVLATSATGKARDFAALDMLEPVSYGERLGSVGEQLIGSLMQGERTKFDMIRSAAKETDQIMKDVGFNGYDVSKWRDNVHEFKLGSGAKVKMSETQIMSLWLTAKRPQGLLHLMGSGMRVETTKKTGSQTANYWLTEGDLRNITSVLSSKQRQAAERMQQYLAGPLAKAGNDITQRMYLFDAFTEQTYWPITSDKSALKTEEPDADRRMMSILNSGFTKALVEKAHNAVMIQDAFDVFGKHVNEMASYVGYAEPMTDIMSWMNYRTTAEDANGVEQQTGSVKQSVERVLGAKGMTYLTTLLQDINGARHGGDNTQLGTLLSNYKAAAVRGKIRVAIQQPTSIVRAAMEMSPKYLIEGLKVGKGTTEEMMEHSSLAWWKANGNYDMGMGKSSDQILWGDTSKAQHVIERIETVNGLIDPGKFDDWAWTRMWQATKKEIEATTDLIPGTDEYWKAVDDRFCEVMDRTQVVDTVMHRSQLMRSKDMLTKTLTSFQAEPTKTYNMMARAVMDFGREQSKANALRLWRATQTYVISAAVVAAMTALFDHFKRRDPEDNDDPIWKYIASGKGLEDWASQWGESILDNLNPLSNVPIVQDVWGALNGEEAEITALSGITDLAKAVGTVEDYLDGNSKKRTMYGAFAPLLKAVGQLTGLPVNGMLANTEMMLNAIDPTILRTKQAIQTNADAYEQMYQLMAKGDTKGADKLRAELKKGLYGGTAKSDKEIDSGIADALALNDPRIAEMVELRKTGKDTKKLLALKKEVMADGFSDAIVTRATNVLISKKESQIKDEYMALYEQTQIPWYEREGWTKQETLEKRMQQLADEAIEAGITTAEEIKKWKAEKNVDKQLEVGSSSVTKLFSNDDLLASVTGGSTSDVKTTFDYLVSVSDAKEPEKGIQSALTKEIKPMYIEAVEKGKTKEAQKIAQNLIAIGYTQDKIDAWVKDDVTDTYKDKYVDAVRAGKDASAAANKLLAAGQTQDTLDGWVKSAYYGDIWDSVLAGDLENAGKLIKEAKSRTGVETKNIVSSLNSKISKEYTELMAAGKTREAERLAQNAYSLGLTKKDGTNYYNKAYFEKLMK